jgi:hypothetical protein
MALLILEHGKWGGRIENLTKRGAFCDDHDLLPRHSGVDADERVPLAVMPTVGSSGNPKWGVVVTCYGGSGASEYNEVGGGMTRRRTQCSGPEQSSAAMLVRDLSHAAMLTLTRFRSGGIGTTMVQGSGCIFHSPHSLH